MAERTPKRGFLIMPFDESVDWIQKEVVEAARSHGVRIERADDIFVPGTVLDQILTAIDEACVIVAVCTGRNPNVFFELGYAMRYHRPILIAEDASRDLPFDVRHLRAEVYGSSADPRRMTLCERVGRAIGAVLDGPTPFREAVRLSAQLQPYHGDGHRLQVLNPGTVDMRNVNVKVPEEAAGFHLDCDGLPIGTVRPGDHPGFRVDVTPGVGKRVFDIVITGETDRGDRHEFPVLISL